jgi:hypothetical protein
MTCADGAMRRTPALQPIRATLGQTPKTKGAVPLITIKTGFATAEGNEETLTEYLCDWPGCPNIAVHMLGGIRELRAIAVVCEEHKPSGRRTSA